MQARAGKCRVYNLVVNVDHTYHVSKLGILAHNSYAIVLGERMDRVRAVARALGFGWYRARKPFLVEKNETWLAKMIEQGKKIFDIGKNRGGDRSDFYKAERKLLIENGFTKQFRQWIQGNDGKWYRLFEWVR
jgi:hypothetical protein